MATGTTAGSSTEAPASDSASDPAAVRATVRPEAVPEHNRFPTRVVGPIVQFSLLIVPIVMNTFFLVYALMGLILEERDLLNWSIEARPNAPWVCAGIVAYSVLVAAFALLRGARPGHPLVVSSGAHGAVALACTALILATVRG